jgi:hypothetical protein
VGAVEVAYVQLAQLAVPQARAAERREDRAARAHVPSWRSRPASQMAVDSATPSSAAIAFQGRFCARMRRTRSPRSSVGLETGSLVADAAWNSASSSSASRKFPLALRDLQPQVAVACRVALK